MIDEPGFYSTPSVVLCRIVPLYFHITNILLPHHITMATRSASHIRKAGNTKP